MPIQIYIFKNFINKIVRYSDIYAQMNKSNGILPKIAYKFTTEKKTLSYAAIFYEGEKSKLSNMYTVAEWITFFIINLFKKNSVTIRYGRTGAELKKEISEM